MFKKYYQLIRLYMNKLLCSVNDHVMKKIEPDQYDTMLQARLTANSHKPDFAQSLIEELKTRSYVEVTYCTRCDKLEISGHLCKKKRIIS